MRACFATALDTQMKHGSVKANVFSWTILWKWYLMIKVSYGISLVIWLIKRMVQWEISTACTVISSEIGPKAYKDIVSTKNLSQYFECLVKNAGNFQYSVRPCQHWRNWKRGNGKRETFEKWHWKTRNRQALLNSTFNKNIWHIIPVSYTHLTLPTIYSV